jgi:hypothetical protein
MLNAAPARAACGAAHAQQKQQLPIKQYAARACAPRRPARAVAALAAAAPTAEAAPAPTRRPSTVAVETAPQLTSSSNKNNQQRQQLLSLAVSAAPASALLALALALAAASPAEAAERAAAAAAHAHAHAHAPLYSLSEGEDFFANVARYGRYFVTVMLGTGYMMVKPVVGLVKKGPLTAVLALGGGAAAVYVIKFTLDAMLGLSDPVVYDPDAVVSQALIRMAQ